VFFEFVGHIAHPARPCWSNLRFQGSAVCSAQRHRSIPPGQQGDSQSGPRQGPLRRALPSLFPFPPFSPLLKVLLPVSLRQAGAAARYARPPPDSLDWTSSRKGCGANQLPVWNVQQPLALADSGMNLSRHPATATPTARFQTTLQLPPAAASVRSQVGRTAARFAAPGEADPKAKARPSRRPSPQRSRLVMAGMLSPEPLAEAPQR